MKEPKGVIIFNAGNKDGSIVWLCTKKNVFIVKRGLNDVIVEETALEVNQFIENVNGNKKSYPTGDYGTEESILNGKDINQFIWCEDGKCLWDFQNSSMTHYT